MRSDRWPHAVNRLLAARRRVRFRFLLSQVRTWDGMNVIDLGCGRTGRSTTELAPRTWKIVGVDRYPPSQVAHTHPGFRYVQADVTDLSAFRDHEFDLAIAVGLLEHVTEPAAFEAAAREIQRVARQYAVIVPYRFAWIEPHFLVPLFPILPRAVRNALVRIFDLHGYRDEVRADPGFVDRRVTWRSNGAYRATFPGSSVLVTPTRDTVLVVRREPDPRPRRTVSREAAARRSRHDLATRLGIGPAISGRVRARLATAIAEAASRSPGQVAALDAGCGRRSALESFRSRLHRLVGTDLHVPDPPLPYLDEFVAGDLCSPNPPIPAGAFDVVLSDFTIEHFSDPGAAVANLFRSLRPGGHLIVTTVNRRHPFVAAYLALPSRVQRRLQPLVKRSGAHGHALVGACNDPASLRSALEGAGFGRIELETVGNLARSWGPRKPIFLLGLIGDLLMNAMPSRRSTILAVGVKPATPA
jgi:2-polyprenyl-3-methyl-5-hydroxy-6-metoxy-1,4-benzoquinol methylase